MSKMVRKGFILMEWMIQFLLCTLIGILAFALFRTWSTRLTALHHSLDATLQLPNALDVLRRDLQGITNERLEVSRERCKIALPGQQIQWLYENGILYRSQKKYDPMQKKWRKAVKNVAAEKLSACIFVPLYSATAPGIISGLRVQCGNPTSTHVFGLRNGKEL
jgi:type II secretory pathway component PulJ